MNVEEKESYMQYLQDIGTPGRLFDGFDPHSFRTFCLGLQEKICYKGWYFKWWVYARIKNIDRNWLNLKKWRT
jgi:hypothetical protein